jgi:hypothetical protein
VGAGRRSSAWSLVNERIEAGDHHRRLHSWDPVGARRVVRLLYVAIVCAGPRELC